MKLVLCSEGFYTPNTVQACVELCGKPQTEISVAIINEAFAVEGGDKRWVLDNLNDVARNFPAELDIVDLLALPIAEVENRLSSKDVIFMVGGNADYLMQLFNKSGFAKLLPKLLETKVYVGSSAGSRVIGRKVSNQGFNKVFGNQDTYGTTEYMRLVDFAITPHINSKHFPDRKPETLAQTAGDTAFPVYGLEDDSAIIVNGSEQTFTGTQPYKVS